MKNLLDSLHVGHLDTQELPKLPFEQQRTDNAGNPELERWGCHERAVAFFQGSVLKYRLSIIELRRFSLSSNSKLNTTLWVWWFAAKCQCSSILIAYDKIILLVFDRKELFGLNPDCG